MPRDSVLVIVACHNAERWIERCVESALTQRDVNVHVVVYDDASADETPQLLRSVARRDERLRILHGDVRRGAAHARWKALFAARAVVAPGDVVVLLDGDDHLVGDHALATVNAFQRDRGLLASHGNYEDPDSVPCPWAADYSSQIKSTAAYRAAPWLATHTRAFRYGLLEHIPRTQILDADGTPLRAATDVALFVNALELAGSRTAFNAQVTYRYNTRGGEALSDARKAEQTAAAAVVRSKPRLTPLRARDVERLLADDRS